MATHFRNTKRVVLIATVCNLFDDCVQQYVSPYKSPFTGYLVVNGFISGNGMTTYSLTRTIPLPGDSTVPVVTGARLQVEGSDGSVYPLSELGNGQYGVNSTRYYEWAFDQTYEYHSALPSEYVFVPSDTSVVLRIALNIILPTWTLSRFSTILVRRRPQAGFPMTEAASIAGTRAERHKNQIIGQINDENTTINIFPFA